MFDFGEERVKYPVGEHNFGELRRGGYLYVDKTKYVAKIISHGKFIFLGRPRRFGKSLLMTTIESYFRGEKELFDGTWIGERETEWKQYPVLHFDMSRISGYSAELMNGFLHRQLSEYEQLYDLPLNDHLIDVGERFSTLIKSIYKRVECQVVILIDEYDNGILETLDAPEAEKEAMNRILRAFYKQPKAMTEYVKFCMVTGVARFGSYTLFSGPNNYNDISMNTDYAACCGITQQELIDNFQEGISKFCKENDWNQDKTLEVLRQKYDSYRFSRNEDLVYNPFSLLLAFDNTALSDYWIKSGTSKIFVKYLTKCEFDLVELQELWVSQSRMEGVYSKEDSVPLLFQTGYLTIKSIKKNENGDILYRLGIPNGEVRSALVDQLMPLYMGMDQTEFTNKYDTLTSKFTSGDIAGWISELKAMIADIPYHLFEKKKKNIKPRKTASTFERTYHIIVHIIFQMLNLDPHSEIAVSGGRIDMVVYTNRFVYVIEFKLDVPASDALAQIDDRGYALKWSPDHRKVIKVGISFSSKTRTIADYDYLPKN